jgi:hypothetical protein
MRFCFCPTCALVILEDGGRRCGFTCSRCQKFWLIFDVIETAEAVEMALSRVMRSVLVVPALVTERYSREQYKEVIS